MVSLTAFRLAEAAAPAPLLLAMEKRKPGLAGEDLTRKWSSRLSCPHSHRAAALTPAKPRPRRAGPAPSRRAPTHGGVDLNLEPRSPARNFERGVSVRIRSSASTPLAGSRTAARRDWPVASPRPVPWLAGDSAEGVKESAPVLGCAGHAATSSSPRGCRHVLRGGSGLNPCLELDTSGFLAPAVPARSPRGEEGSRDRGTWKLNGRWK